MSRRRASRTQAARSLAANPVLVGGVTTLVVLVAVVLAYNANQGLPFVPTFQLRVEAPDAARLVVGNEVREGGERIGQISEIETVRRSGGRTGAVLTLQLDKKAAPIPRDSRVIIRPRSTLGLKYIDLRRGRSREALKDGSVIVARAGAVPPELDEVFGMFDDETREDARTNLVTGGNGFAARGQDLNRVLETLPPLLTNVVPVMDELAEPGNDLARTVREMGDAARVTAPVTGDLVAGFRDGAEVFEALSRDGGRPLQELIEESPPTLRTGIRELPRQRPFLQRVAAISDEMRGTAAELRASAGPIGRALASGTETLPGTVPLSEQLGGSFEALGDLVRAPTTNLVLRGLQTTMGTLNPTLRWAGPHQTVCNYWTYFWTFLSDHLSERVDTGTVQRIQVKLAPGSLARFGATEPANGEPVPEPEQAVLGDPVNLHAQPYGRAVDEQGAADCESGQRGYPRRLAATAPAGLNVAVDPRTPGNQGPTFKGRPRVPQGQTFSAEPTGRAPEVARSR